MPTEQNTEANEVQEAQPEVNESEAIESQEADNSEASPEEKPQTLREALSEAVEKAESEDKEVAAVEDKPEDNQETQAPVQAPNGMPKELAAKFGELGKEWQDFIHKREYDVRRYISQKGEELQQEINKIGPLYNTISENRDYLAKRRISETDVVQNAIAWDKAFDENPLAAAKSYLASWGVHPADLLDDDGMIASDDYIQQHTPTQQGPTPEEIEAMVNERVEKAIQYQQQSWATQQKQKAVESFITSNPVFQDPAIAAHFEPAMAQVLARLNSEKPNSPTADLLQEAYNETLSSPAFRGLKEQLEAKETQERSRQKAEKAKKASRSVKGSLGSTKPKRKYNDLGENLRANFTGDL